jgi:hypothetical protein
MFQMIFKSRNRLVDPARKGNVFRHINLFCPIDPVSSIYYYMSRFQNSDKE